METTPSQPLLAYNVWLDYPKETRAKLAQLFNIKRSGDVVVNNAGIKDGMPVTIVTSDGYRPADLYAITVERMQYLLGSKSTDFYQLLDTVIAHISALVDGTYVAPSLIPPAPKPPAAKKVAAKKVAAKKVVAKKVVQPVVPPAPEVLTLQPTDNTL